MPLTRPEVEAIAHLSRLSLTPEELDRFGTQIDAILGYVQLLEKLELAGVEPTAQVSAETDRTRPDAVTPGITNAEVAGIAPEFRAGSVRVPRILEE